MCARLSRHQNAQHKLSLYTQSESVLCQGEERAKHKREGERKSKSDRASGRNKWELSKDEAGVAHSLVLRFLLSYKSTKSLEKRKREKRFEGGKVNGCLIIFKMPLPLLIA